MKTIVVPLLATRMDLLRSRASLQLEILALRQQLSLVADHERKRLRFRPSERLFWVWLYRLWPSLMSPNQVRRLKQRDTANALQDVLYPALDRLLETLGEDYLVQAPEAAGLYQYPGGRAYYKRLIRRETSLDLTPDQIHQRGLQAMDGIQQKMQAIRQKLGFTGTAAEFHQQLRADKWLYASSPEELEQRYQAYVDRIEPRLPEYFSQQPQAPYGYRQINYASTQIAQPSFP